MADAAVLKQLAPTGRLRVAIAVSPSPSAQFAVRDGDGYKGVAGITTVGVHAIWATSGKQSEELIYKVTAALWNPSTRKLLDSGHAKGRQIRLETATRGLGIPLHAGAEKFYKEQGLIR